MMPDRESQHIVSIDGQRITLTHLDKVLYPQTGTTKENILQYYADIAPYMVPHTTNRPATRKRWVHGVGTPEKPNEPFYQKNLDASTPNWVARQSIEHHKHTVDYPLVNDPATLIWLAQIAALEIHVPQWQFHRTGGARNPDRLVLDLDPGPGVGLIECAEVARLARNILRDMGFDALPVTSGSKGVHLYAPLDGRLTSDQISSVAHELARALEADHQELITSDMKRSRREGRVFVDWSQNNSAKTTIAAYSLRGTFSPMVAAPRTWQEMASPTLRHLSYDEILERVRSDGDLLQPLLASRDAGLEPTTDHMNTFITTNESHDRLSAYRKRRNQAITPEPIPEQTPSPTSGASFVIQEHHARRLHYDFRLEHDGVLVSWAIPKGPPLAHKTNHLAIQTEDHPLEYGMFEGTIPQGEYGGGDVKIWDTGEYKLEKWRTDQEIIVTLTGRKNGGLGGLPRTYALIHTGTKNNKSNWLIHLMDDNGTTKKPPHRIDDSPERPIKRSPRPSHKSPEPPTTHSESDVPDVPVSGLAAIPIAPMLTTKGTQAQLAHREEWAYEMKWDGFRAIIHVTERNTQIFSRNGKDLTTIFPELGEPLRHAMKSHTGILDAEIVAINAQGRPDFALLQTRTGLSTGNHRGSRSAPRSRKLPSSRISTTQKEERAVPIHIMLFDVLQLDEQHLVNDIYDVRRAALNAIITENDRVHIAPHIDSSIDIAIETSRELHLEGVIAKKHNSTYQPGHRSRDWIKIKHTRTQEVVVAGWSSQKETNFTALGALILGIPDKSGIRYVGHVGTGFSEKERATLPQQLEPRSRSTSPLHSFPPEFVSSTRWIEPQLVGEVTYLNWTTDGILRQPVWRGWRPDKNPDDVILE